MNHGWDIGWGRQWDSVLPMVSAEVVVGSLVTKASQQSKLQSRIGHWAHWENSDTPLTHSGYVLSHILLLFIYSETYVVFWSFDDLCPFMAKLGSVTVM